MGWIPPSFYLIRVRLPKQTRRYLRSVIIPIMMAFLGIIIECLKRKPSMLVLADMRPLRGADRKPSIPLLPTPAQDIIALSTSVLETTRQLMFYGKSIKHKSREVGGCLNLSAARTLEVMLMTVIRRNNANNHKDIAKT